MLLYAILLGNALENAKDWGGTRNNKGSSRGKNKNRVEHNPEEVIQDYCEERIEYELDVLLELKCFW